MGVAPRGRIEVQSLQSRVESWKRVLAGTDFRGCEKLNALVVPTGARNPSSI
jgi:hypothetical protein